MPKPVVTVYTDGACEPNPGPGGWAAVLYHGSHKRVLTGREPTTTSNRMELQAAISALEALREPCLVQMHTDSQYLQRGITEWLPRWVSRGWRKSDKRPVLNVELWKKLHQLTLRHEVQWHWVRGHSGDANNELANRLASQAMHGKATPRVF